MPLLDRDVAITVGVATLTGAAVAWKLRDRSPKACIHVCGSREDLVGPTGRAVIAANEVHAGAGPDVSIRYGARAVSDAVDAAIARLSAAPGGTDAPAQLLCVVQYYPTMTRKHIGGPSGPYKEAWEAMDTFRRVCPELSPKLRVIVLLTNVAADDDGTASRRTLELNEDLAEPRQLVCLSSPEVERLAAGVSGGADIRADPVDRPRERRASQPESHISSVEVGVWVQGWLTATASNEAKVAGGKWGAASPVLAAAVCAGAVSMLLGPMLLGSAQSAVAPLDLSKVPFNVLAAELLRRGV